MRSAVNKEPMPTVVARVGECARFDRCGVPSGGDAMSDEPTALELADRLDDVDRCVVSAVRGLSLNQPYASLVALGVKRWETRSKPLPKTITPDVDVFICSTVAPPVRVFDDTPAGQRGRVGGYNVGQAAERIERHASPCDCNEDDEETGERCMAVNDWGWALFDDDANHGPNIVSSLPLGAVVAVVRFTESLPIGEGSWLTTAGPHRHRIAECAHEGDLPHQQGGLWLFGGTPTRIEDQRPYGDWEPGRFAYRIADVRPLAEPVSVRGDGVHHQGFWRPSAATVAAVREQVDANG